MRRWCSAPHPPLFQPSAPPESSNPTGTHPDRPTIRKKPNQDSPPSPSSPPNSNLPLLGSPRLPAQTSPAPPPQTLPQQPSAGRRTWRRPSVSAPDSSSRPTGSQVESPGNWTSRRHRAGRRRRRRRPLQPSRPFHRIRARSALCCWVIGPPPPTSPISSSARPCNGRRYHSPWGFGTKIS